MMLTYVLCVLLPVNHHQAASVPYIVVQMFRDLNLNSFFRGYGHSIMSKISFMISGAFSILTLNISISNVCKLRSRGRLLQEVHQATPVVALQIFYALCRRGSTTDYCFSDPKSTLTSMCWGVTMVRLPDDGRF